MSEEEKKAIECIKQELIEPFYNFPNPTSIELKDIKVEFLERVINLVDKQQKEIEREKQYTEFYKELSEKQQEKMNDFILYMKEKLNNIDCETEFAWRRIEKLEK